MRAPDEWPGFVALAGRTGQSLETKWFDWTGWHRARCPDGRTAFERTTTLALHKLPALAHRTDQEYLKDIVEGIEPLSDGERVLGVDRVLDTDVSARPIA